MRLFQRHDTLLLPVCRLLPGGDGCGSSTGMGLLFYDTGGLGGSEFDCSPANDKDADGQYVDNQVNTPPDKVAFPRVRKRLAFLRTILKAAGITALAFLLSYLFASPFTATVSTLFSSPEKGDFRMPDLFFQIADNRPVRTLDDRIVILDIGNLDRDGIAETLSILSLCEPRTVAVDLNFDLPADDDSGLLSSLGALPTVVLPLGVEESERGFRLSERPFFYGELSGLRYGVVNFPTTRAGATVRDFATFFPMSDGSRILSFPEAAASAAGYDATPDIEYIKEEKGTPDTGIIAYHSKEIPIIVWDELPERAEELADKIVLVGTTGDASDVYSTPVRHGMSGVEIHAYALSSILDGSRLRRVSSLWTDSVAAVLCFLMVWGAIGIRSATKGLILRVAQVLSLSFLVWAGYSLLVDHDLVCDFSKAILMIAFGLFAVDLWNGSVAMSLWVYGKISAFLRKRRAYKV